MIKHLTLHLTNACNLNCEYCHVAAIRNTSNTSGFISDHDIMKLFPDSVYSVSVAGGEPFLDKQRLYHLLNLIPSTIRSVAVTTNGTLLEDRDFDILKSKHVRIQFSIDGKKENHEENRGEHTYDLLKGNIDKAIFNGLRVDLLTTVGNSSLDSIVSFVKEADKNGVDNITLLHFTPKGRGKAHGSEEVDDIKWFEFVTTIGKKLNNQYTRVWIQPRFMTEELVKQCNSIRDITFCNCFDPQYAYVDLTTGKVYPCGLSFGTPICFGNISNSSILTINDVLNNNEKFVIPQECSDCQKLTFCKGGAKCYSWLEAHDFNRKDPHCEGNSLLPICPFPAIMVSGPSMQTKQPTIV